MDKKTEELVCLMILSLGLMTGIAMFLYGLIGYSESQDGFSFHKSSTIMGIYIKYSSFAIDGLSLVISTSIFISFSIKKRNIITPKYVLYCFFLTYSRRALHELIYLTVLSTNNPVRFGLCAEYIWLYLSWMCVTLMIFVSVRPKNNISKNSPVIPAIIIWITMTTHATIHDYVYRADYLGALIKIPLLRIGPEVLAVNIYPSALLSAIFTSLFYFYCNKVYKEVTKQKIIETVSIFVFIFSIITAYTEAVFWVFMLDIDSQLYFEYGSLTLTAWSSLAWLPIVILTAFYIRMLVNWS